MHTNDHETDRLRRLTATLAAVGTLAVLGIVLSSGVAGAVPSTSCATSDGGAPYVTTSNLTVYENDPSIHFGNFPSHSSVEFGSIAFNASGTASVRMDDGSGSEPCLADLDANSNPINVTADGAGTFVFDGEVDVVSFRAPDYSESDSDTDLAYEASSGFTVRMPAPGVGTGQTVQALDASDTVLDESTVSADGTVEFDLGSGSKDVNVRATGPPVVCIGGSAPIDHDGDGKYEDLDGDGSVTFADINCLYSHLVSGDDPVDPFDFNDNEEIDFGDINLLYQELVS